MLQLNYIEPVFRPPSEWRSLILQVTNGCSWNQCTFCEMYQAPQKQFDFKPLKQVREELRQAISSGVMIERIFLADGDAMALSSRRLNEILDCINEEVPDIRRVTAYCLPRNVRNKSLDELITLRNKGLTMVYVGCETGDSELLSLVDKGETYETSLDALLKLKQAGIKTSVMILNGLGGVSHSEQHINASAQLMNASQPDYLSTLVVSFPRGDARFRKQFPQFRPLDQQSLFRELYRFIELLQLKSTIFRSDHASNYLPLKGVLNKHQSKLLAQLDKAINTPEQVALRPESMRGL